MSGPIRKLSIVVNKTADNEIYFDQKLNPRHPSNSSKADHSSQATVKPQIVRRQSTRIKRPIKTASVFYSEASRHQDEPENLFWEKDDKKLIKAVNAIGYDMESISKHWFESEKTPLELWNRIQLLNIPEPKRSKRVIGQSKRDSLDEGPSSLLYPLSNKRKREIVSLEEKRLFGKARSEHELNVIAQGVHVGKNSFGRLMKMNRGSHEFNVDGDQDTGVNVNLTVDSLEALMEDAADENLKQTIALAKRNTVRKRLPKAVALMTDDQVYSPNENQRPGRLDESSNLMDQNKVGNQSVKCAQEGNVNEKVQVTDESNRQIKKKRMLVFRQNELNLPFQQAIDETLLNLTPQKNDEDNYSDLEEFVSPKLDNGLPLIPMTPIPERNGPKMYYYFP